MIMKKYLATAKTLCIAVLLGTALLAGCSTQSNVEVTERSQAKSLTILAVNDMHAALDNFPRLAVIVDELRETYPDLLLVSGGDNQTGNPANDQYPQKGLPMIELMNALEFDLSALGNHEFDSGVQGLEYLTHKANFDFLAANVEPPADADFRIKPYTIIETNNGLKVAFLSLLDINVNGIPDTHPDNVKGFTFSDPFDIAQQYMFLKDKSDVFVMVNHLGFEEDVQLANQLPVNTVDLIIGGHSHTKVDNEQIHNGVMITQAERRLNYATLIQISVNPDGTVDKQQQLLTVGKDGPTRADIQAMVDGYNSNPALTETIALAEDGFSSYEEIGYLVSDSLRAEAKTDIGLINAGGVRISSLAQGPVRTRDVYEIDPFGNEMVLFKLTGHELRDMFLFAYTFDENKPIYPSGLTVQYLLNADGSLQDIKFFAADGKPMDMNKTYSVIMNNYMASVYKFERKDPGQGLFRPTAEATIEYLKSLKNIPSYQGVQRVEILAN